MNRGKNEEEQEKKNNKQEGKGIEGGTKGKEEDE